MIPSCDRCHERTNVLRRVGDVWLCGECTACVDPLCNMTKRYRARIAVSGRSVPSGDGALRPVPASPAKREKSLMATTTADSRSTPGDRLIDHIVGAIFESQAALARVAAREQREEIEYRCGCVDGCSRCSGTGMVE